MDGCETAILSYFVGWHKTIIASVRNRNIAYPHAALSLLHLQITFHVDSPQHSLSELSDTESFSYIYIYIYILFIYLCRILFLVFLLL